MTLMDNVSKEINVLHDSCIDRLTFNSDQSDHSLSNQGIFLIMMCYTMSCSVSSYSFGKLAFVHEWRTKRQKLDNEPLPSIEMKKKSKYFGWYCKVPITWYSLSLSKVAGRCLWNHRYYLMEENVCAQYDLNAEKVTVSMMKEDMQHISANAGISRDCIYRGGLIYT